MLKQKSEFENLLKDYVKDNKLRNSQRLSSTQRQEKNMVREQKLQEAREKFFEEELRNQQKSRILRRNAQQVRLCQKMYISPLIYRYQLAAQLEKNKLIQEKKEFMEERKAKNEEKRKIFESIETFYKDRVNMLKETIEKERFERKVAGFAQKQVSPPSS